MENITNVAIAKKRLIEVRNNNYTFFKNFEHVIGNNDAVLFFADLSFDPYAVLTIKKDTPIKLLPKIIDDLKEYFEVRN